MKLGAYQFAVSKDIKRNLEIMKKAVAQASQKGIKLLVFPECALTGYPPHDIESSSSVSFDDLKSAYEQLQNLSMDNTMHILVGAVTKESNQHAA